MRNFRYPSKIFSFSKAQLQINTYNTVSVFKIYFLVEFLKFYELLQKYMSFGLWAIFFDF